MASKQESMSDYYDMAKEMAKAENSLKVERWVRIVISYKDKGQNVNLYRYDLPVWQKEKWEWVIRWRRAKLQCQYPKQYVECAYDYYKKVQGVTIGMQDALNHLIAAKAQVSKQERLIAEYVECQRSTNFFFDEENDEQLQKVKIKLKNKKLNLALAEQNLMELVKKQLNKKNRVGDG